MQGPNTQNTSNVVSLFASRNKEQASGESSCTAEEIKPGEEKFDNIIERNMKNNERLRKERLNANKSVLRSYRIKN
jgi:hypothetical protein